ncbi:hypothetical protein MKX03_009294 [Papaver bracteatum]|nr:hypothetical protein MKX03_009294 [Papaver bracteatum]
MISVLTILFFAIYLILVSDSHPLCTNLKAPFTPETPLVFCPYDGTNVCCDAKQDLRLQKVFQAMNISDPSCASVYKSILCAKCDMFSADLFKIESGTRTVPVLCTVSTNSTRSKSAVNGFCSKVWDLCHSAPVLNSPFLPSSVRNASSKLCDHWQSKNVFCEDFGGSSDDGHICYDGKSSSLQKNEALPQPISGICLEKIANGSYLDMASHPDGSNRIFLGSLQGKIWLATVPEEGSGEELVIDELNPFLDLTDIVHFDTELGFMGMAFHPNFTSNGRFFVSYNFDCDPSKLSPTNGAVPCQYHSVISEFTANGTASNPSSATRVEPVEVRRIFTMGIAFRGTHGGQILFGPDGCLYFMTGDDESEADSYNFGQNKKSLLGKILRFDVEDIPSETEISKLNLFGNYSVPKDNPHSDDKELRPEIWALGFRNPWRCSFDSERPSYFICGDAGQDQYEEVDVVTRGGNYGWPFYEGAFPFHHQNTGNNHVTLTDFISPVIGYNHSVANTNDGSASITGGYFYRSETDPCLYGKYLYSDLYGAAIWAGTEDPENSGNFTTSKLSYSCAHNSPIQCSSKDPSSHFSLGFVFSVGTDNNKDIFFLTGNGVLRVARPSRCNYACIKENLTTDEKPHQKSPSASSTNILMVPLLKLLLSLFFLLFLSL